MTLIDGQYELIRVLRPRIGFEAQYQGVAATRPVAFPGELDERAGTEGYLENLGAGFKVPARGAHLKIWIPLILTSAGEAFSPEYGYVYQINWRLRNMADFVEDAAKRVNQPTPFSIKARVPGYSDSGNKRWFIPGGSDTLLYEQAEPAGAGDPGLVVGRTQRYQSMINAGLAPLAPDGSNLLWQQGVYQNAGTASETGSPTYMVFDLEAQGDEMSIYAFKTSENDWDFAENGEDEGFSYTYGTDGGTRQINESIGILISAGASAS